MIRMYNREDWGRIVRGFRTSLPGVVVSVGIHAILLLIMALIVYREALNKWGDIELGWSTVVEEEDSAPEEETESPIVLPKVSIGSQTTTTPPEPPKPATETADTSAAAPNPEVKLADVSRSLRFRKLNEDKRPQTGVLNDKESPSEAIAAALEWLARQQLSEGNWSLQGPYPDGGSIETLTGATSLALLAFLGDGHTHRSGEHQSVVNQGLQWLIKQQRPSGDLFDSDEQGREPHFYSHAQGTIVLCEALALTGDQKLLGPAQRAVQFLIDAQNPVLGGWKYRPLQPDGIGDLSVSGWVLMALHSARMADIPVPLETFLVAEKFLTAVEEESGNGALYKYRPDLPAEESQRHSMTAEGLLCRQWLGWPKHHPAMRRGMAFLVEEKNLPVWARGQRNLYAWYYTAQTLHNLDGPEWRDWYGRTSSLIVKEQLRGSWHPFRPQGAFMERSRDGGRLYLTVMCVLVLETPFRHAPIYLESSE
ncbi:MAG: terpene cyclase/mutase family protein [Planctomycetaceae bacterium]|nr:terpene cyclase/mutase family protein [Planctomycetaceae bacterium]